MARRPTMSRSPKGLGRPRGFTILELLTSVGVIAVLVAIAVPSLSGVRRSANQMACAAQLRTLTTGLRLYADANRALPNSSVFIGVRTLGSAPPPPEHAPPEHDWPDHARLDLPLALAPYLETEPPSIDRDGLITLDAPWTCPDERRFADTDRLGHRFVPDGFSYAYAAAGWGVAGRSLSSLYIVPTDRAAGRASLLAFEREPTRVILADDEAFHAADPANSTGTTGKNRARYDGSVAID